jgi:hypothetical protein
MDSEVRCKATSQWKEKLKQPYIFKVSGNEKGEKLPHLGKMRCRHLDRDDEGAVLSHVSHMDKTAYFEHIYMRKKRCVQSHMDHIKAPSRGRSRQCIDLEVGSRADQDTYTIVQGCARRADAEYTKVRKEA